MESVLFDGLIGVHYGFIQVYSESEDWPDSEITFRGQTNGLLGGAHPGHLFVSVGLHTGDVPVRVVLHDVEPALGEWEDIVEVSFRPKTTDLWVLGFDEGTEIQLPIATYRARWSASHMDAGNEHGVTDFEGPAPDRYELALWPVDEQRPDAILRQTSHQAAYWHGTRGSK